MKQFTGVSFLIYHQRLISFEKTQKIKQNMAICDDWHELATRTFADSIYRQAFKNRIMNQL